MRTDVLRSLYDTLFQMEESAALSAAAGAVHGRDRRAVARKLLKRLRRTSIGRRTLIHPAHGSYETGMMQALASREQTRCMPGIGIARRKHKGQGVRVRITERPRERDIEGVNLDTLRPGSVCDVSATIGSWLILQGYAYPEMRRTPEEGDAAAAAPPTTGNFPERRRR
jgi:hypothetical protein